MLLAEKYVTIFKMFIKPNTVIHIIFHNYQLRAIINYYLKFKYSMLIFFCKNC